MEQREINSPRTGRSIWWGGTQFSGSFLRVDKMCATVHFRIYYFENTASPGLVWVKFDQVDFKAGSGTRKLTLEGQPDLGGNQSSHFKQADPFKFLAPAVH